MLVNFMPHIFLILDQYLSFFLINSLPIHGLCHLTIYSISWSSICGVIRVFPAPGKQHIIKNCLGWKVCGSLFCVFLELYFKLCFLIFRDWSCSKLVFSVSCLPKNKAFVKYVISLIPKNISTGYMSMNFHSIHDICWRKHISSSMELEICCITLWNFLSLYLSIADSNSYW